MSASGRSDPEQLLADARGGRTGSLGRVLELLRTDLALLARAQIGFHLRGRLDASDLVQETFLDACRDFHHFRGTTHREWVAWLRKILFYNLARVVQRQVAAKKRSTRREVSLDQQVSAMDGSSGTIPFETALVSRSSSPSSHARRRERAACLADQLARLPTDYREVLVLRNLEGLPFPEVASRMNRSAGAVRILWVRAVDQLRRLLEAEELL
jgi:RNA polymerase sigma-70 factor (ECF subfamily)